MTDHRITTRGTRSSADAQQDLKDLLEEQALLAVGAHPAQLAGVHAKYRT